MRVSNNDNVINRMCIIILLAPLQVQKYFAEIFSMKIPSIVIATFTLAVVLDGHMKIDKHSPVTVIWLASLA